MDTGTMIVKTLELMGIGVGGVFAVLAVFYGLVLLMRKIFPAKRNDNK